jgi:hypothetical protein
MKDCETLEVVFTSISGKESDGTRDDDDGRMRIFFGRFYTSRTNICASDLISKFRGLPTKLFFLRQSRVSPNSIFAAATRRTTQQQFAQSIPNNEEEKERSYTSQKMPAPTALLRRPEELAEAVSVPLPSESKRTLPVKSASSILTDMIADQDDEFLLDAPEAVSLETNVIQPAGGEDSEMHIDEEGRPRFAPAKSIVRGLLDSLASRISG